MRLALFLHPREIHDRIPSHPLDLHPLSLESLLHVPGPPRSGADYYKKHLFIRVLSHSLNEDGGEEPNLLEQLAGSPSTEPFELGDEVEILPKPSIYDTPRSSGLTSKLSSKLKRSNRPGSTEAGDDDVDATNPTTHAGYDSLYPNYVRLLLPFRFFCLAASLFRNKGTRSTRPSSSSCKSLKRVGD